MKKLLIFLGFVSTFSFMVAPAFPIGLHFDIYRDNGIGDEVWDTEYTMHQGDTIKIDVWLERFRGGVTSFGYTFEYDADLLEAIDIQPKSPWKYSRVECNNYFVCSEDSDTIPNEVDWKRIEIGKTALHTITLKSKKLGESSIKAKKTRFHVGNTELPLMVSDAKAIIKSQDIPNDNFNIVLITIDALRVDHLSCYGYERDTSPNIDKIAEQGIIFKNAISPSSWTVPSMVSLFTSTYPINHGVIHGLGDPRNATKQKVFSNQLITLSEILRSQGYTTFGIASNIHLSKKFGFARGFDYFQYQDGIPADKVNKIIYSWEAAIKKSDKYFLWIHYFDPHHPYSPRSPWIEEYTSQELIQKLHLSTRYLDKLIPTLKKNPQALSSLISLYDSEINYVDAHIGELIQKLELNEKTLIIITSDHGEEFLEHDFLVHGHNLYKETIHVPLIIKLPYSSKKKSVKEYANLIDVMPTVLKILDINPPEQTEGVSLWDKKRTYNLAELDTHAVLKTILLDEWKYIYNYRDKTEQLYNIKLDPLEQNDLLEKRMKQTTELRKKLFNWVATAKKYPPMNQEIHLTQQEKERLEALGYLATQNNEDYDGDGIGNKRDTDDDSDGIPDNNDNCPYVFNPNQEDTYPLGGNRCGDACDCIGNLDSDGEVSVRDVSLFNQHFGRKDCTQQNPCNGDFDCDGDVDDDDYLILKENIGRMNCAACEFSCSYE